MAEARARLVGEGKMHVDASLTVSFLLFPLLIFPQETASDFIYHSDGFFL